MTAAQEHIQGIFTECHSNLKINSLFSSLNPVKETVYNIQHKVPTTMSTTNCGSWTEN